MNYNAFTTEITKQDIAAFEKEYKATRKKSAPTVAIIIGILYVAYLLFSFASGLLGR